MKTKIFLLFLTPIFILSAKLSSFGHARPTIIELSVDSQLMESRQVFVNSKLAGYTSDFIILTGIRNYFEINAPFGGSLSFEIILDPRRNFGRPTVLRPEAKTEECLGFKPNPFKISAWEKPSIENLKKFGPNWFRLSVSTPDFVKTNISADQKKPYCGPLVQAGWSKQRGSFILNIKSQPNGAEVFIDGIRKKFYTDTELSIPYNEEKKEFDILIKKAGYVNYPYTLKHPFHDVNINAKLEAIKEKN